jgi:hypothetical protein
MSINRQQERRMSSTARQPETVPAGKLIPIGRKEYVAFPEWDIWHVRAKVDTGAYSSALDVAGYEVIESPAGLVVRFRFPLRSRGAVRVVSIEAPIVKLVTVCSSSGCKEVRPLIEPLVRLGPVTRRIRLTVTDRSRMRFRMLLGRQALNGTFLVDVGSKYLLGPARRE